MPKSEAPRPFRMRRVVYSDTNIVIPIFGYRYPVFFMTRVAVDDMRRLFPAGGGVPALQCDEYTFFCDGVEIRECDSLFEFREWHAEQ